MQDKIQQIENLLKDLKTDEQPQAEILSICNGRVIFKIPSSRDGYYFVTYNKGGWECTCEHHQYRNAICKHIDEAKDLLFSFTNEVVECNEVLEH